METWISETLGAEPKVHWQTERDRLFLTIDGYVPAHEIAIEGVVPETLEVPVIRSNDFPDIKFRTIREGGALVMKGAIFANRIESFDAKAMIYRHGTLTPQPTRFEFILPRGVDVSAVRVRNRYSGIWSDAVQHGVRGFSPTALNRPVAQSARPPKEYWSGDVRIDRDKVIRAPVEIAAGTHVRMAPGVSLVFRDALTAIGSVERPIRFLPLAATSSGSPVQPWGTVALQGSATRGSQLRHVNFAGGSGSNIQSIPYTGMLSIHDTSDILLAHVRLGQNYIEDDTLHLVYVENAVIRNLTVESAFSDGVDIDVSTVIFDGGRIDSSRNDGIDLMSSDAIITGMDIFDSGDKGVSVGERSTALVHDTVLRQNKIGVESKDSSIATLVHVEMGRNELDLNAYKKNWRYGGGGKIETFLTRFNGAAKVPKADKRSAMTLSGSRFASDGQTFGKRVTVKQGLPSQEDLQARVNAYALSDRARNGLKVDLGHIGAVGRGVGR